MKIGLKLSPVNRDEWQAWLHDNHNKAKEIWLLFYRKKSGKKGIDYVDAVEEALCFGWIDGLRKKVDEERYTCRFTPRRAGSRWSLLNIERSQKMIKEGKMTAAGLTAYEKRICYDAEESNAAQKKELSLTPEMENRLKENRNAWENFNNLSPSYKKRYIDWLLRAKRAQTLEKRLQETLQFLCQEPRKKKKKFSLIIAFYFTFALGLSLSHSHASEYSDRLQVESQEQQAAWDCRFLHKLKREAVLASENWLGIKHNFNLSYSFSDQLFTVKFGAKRRIRAPPSLA